jgi:hypothetical protein
MVTQPLTPHQLTSLLLDARNGDGGWGYYAGKSSRLEPTCWALLALRNANASIDSAVLQRWPARDGLLLERAQGEAQGEPNYAFHALGLLVLSRLLLEHETENIRLAGALQRVKGVSLKPSAAFRQNNALQAWPWVAETFSWVEPTAWCLLALKQFGRSFPASVDSSRIAEAEHLLLDRVCTGGGWNYGNPSVLGQELRAHVPPTAVALLAMQNRRNESAVQQSLHFLESNAITEVSASTLSLTTIALRVYGRSTDNLKTALAKQVPTSVSLGNLLGLSQALFTMNTTYDNSAFSI